MRTMSLLRLATELTSDPCVGVEMAMISGAEGELAHATVCNKPVVRNDDGTPVGVAHDNPLLDSRKYEVKYVVEDLMADLIADNLIAQVDKEGRCHQMMLPGAKIDHRASNDAILQSQGTYVNLYGVKRHKITTRGWELLVECWRDGSSNWVAFRI